MADDGFEEDHICEEGAPAWMATFGDLMSLLLTFFVLLLTFASMDQEMFMEAMGSMREALGVRVAEPGLFAVTSSSPLQFSPEQSSAFIATSQSAAKAQRSASDDDLARKMQDFISSRHLGRSLDVQSSDRGITLRLKGKVLFEPGSDELRPEAFLYLDEIARLAQDFPNDISVEGHTDSAIGGRFDSNWHLSAARAVAVLRYMEAPGGIASRRLSATGYSDTRPLLSANGETVEAASNRRVEFVFLRSRDSAYDTRAERRAIRNPTGSAGS